jgi:hypothetical protein
MSTLKVHNIEPATGTDVALGAAGDSITVSGDSLKLNTFKDAGGNTLFTSDGAGTVSSVNSGLKGAGPILITTNSFTGASSSSFTSGIDSTYDKYMFVLTDINPGTDTASLGVQFNASGQSGFNEAMTTTFWYNQHSENDSTAYDEYDASLDQSSGTAYQGITRQMGGDADESSAGIVYLYNPASTSLVKHFQSRMNSYHSSIYSMDFFVAGFVNVTAAITQIDFKPSSGVFDGKIKMYGIS